uniref:Uncharacterized protein n=1 Tax=Manihot esculenta TaxID=3983 RepID=A0A2C9V5A3_MANES
MLPCPSPILISDQTNLKNCIELIDDNGALEQIPTSIAKGFGRAFDLSLIPKWLLIMDVLWAMMHM